MNARSEDRRGQGADAEKIQRSLTASCQEGVASQIMVGILDSYLVPYALLLGATTSQIGFLAAFPNLLSSISQFFAVRAVNVAGSRLKLMLKVLLTQFVFLLPVPFLVFLPGGRKVLLLIIFIAGFRTLGSLMGPAWGSLVSEYLPPERRGDYFGWRSRIVAVSGVAGVAFWGLFLEAWKFVGTQAWGFFILFLSCTALRVLSLLYMARLADLPTHVHEENEFTFWMFVRRFRESNFVKFVFFVAGLTFATQVATPFLSVYMLKELKFHYVSYMSVILASTIAGLVSFPLWGRHADAVGNAKVLKTTGWIVPFIPLLWIAAKNPIALVIVELAAGFAWGGFNLCATNFIFDAVSPGKRVRCLGYFNLINGGAVFGGASLGAYLSERLPPAFGSSFAALFLVSTALRFASLLIMRDQFREVRENTEPISSLRLFFSVVGLHPFIGRNDELTALPAVAPVHFGDRAAPPRRKTS